MDEERLELALEAIAAARELPMDDPRRQRVQRAVDGLVKDGQRLRKAERRRRTAAHDRSVRAGTATGSADRAEAAPVTEAGLPGQTRRELRCYVCRGAYRTVDRFYHRLCGDCADEHRARRDARTDLSGRSAVVTGGRVKIGFQVALKLLRDGAHVTVVTRFPADAVARFTATADSPGWLSRLTVLGADLRDPRQVLDLADRVAAAGPLDILINNAAQTVRRPDWAYAPLLAAEARARAMLDGPAARHLADVTGTLSQVVDATGALVDPAERNSWTARLGTGEIDPVELIEVQLVNVVAPFLLVDRLRPAMRTPAYVVNVTGREGWFAGDSPPEGHPHTAASKAALGMLTRVGAPGLARQGVHMCAVDTGWITDESPAPRRDRRAATGWRPPLDVVDAAARIYHPVVSGEGGAPLHGVLLRNYAVVPW